MDNSEKPSSSQTHPLAGHEAVPALEVPLSNLQYQEDEMLSWLQYPLEDSFDRNYCSEELYTEAPATHSSFVNDAFSNLTLRDREKLHPIGLRSHTSLPSGYSIRERGTKGDAPTAMHTWEVAGPYDTHKGERVSAANTAMAMGAQRAAGLLFQSGSEAFNKVRTNAQPYTAKRTQNAIPIQETGGSVSNFIPHALKVGAARSRLQPPFQRLTCPNFPLFSRAVGVTKTSLHNNSTGSETPKPVSSTHGKGGEFAFKCEPMTGMASPTVEAHPILEAKDIPLEAFAAPVITKGFSDCFSQLGATGVTGMASSRLPFQCETRRKPFIAHSKEALFTSVIESAKTGTISCKMEAEAIGLTHVEGTSRSLGTPCAETGLHTAAAAAAAAVTSPGLVSSTATTDMDSSLHSELALHDSETSQNRASSGMFLRVGVTTSESKLCETVETGDVTMASPSRGSGDSTEKSIKEAGAFTMKRKAHPAEDSEIESKVVPCKDGKLPQGSARGGKRTRAAEIHNLSERKRRNKINVKMKALQDLIPNANKTDKASILDEAIEYMKLLQSQVQLMSLRTGMVGMPMVLPPGIPSASMPQRLPPPHSNRMGVGSGILDAAPGYFSAAPAIGHPLSGSAYLGLQLVGSHAGIQESHGHSQSPGVNDAYPFLPVQQQQQHLHWNTHTSADMFGAYITQQQQQPSQFQLSARETPRDAMQ